MEKRTNENKVYVVGELVEVKTQERVANSGKVYINGSIVVKVADNNLVELKVLCFKDKSDGTVNKMYQSVKGYDALLNKKVRVSGEFRDEHMVRNDGQLIHFNGVYAKFVNVAKADDAECATFEYSGFVVKSIYERKNKDDELLGYRLDVAQQNYNGTSMQVIRFDIDKNDVSIAEAIEANYTTGATVAFSGTIAFNSRVETKTEEVAFGEPTVKSYTVSDKVYRITGGQEPFSDEAPEAYTVDEIKKYVADYKTADAAYIEAAKNASEDDDDKPAANAMSGMIRSKSLI